ncbi:hypothetical protein M1563_01125 [Patescibacteria group bacterium]|nr:hypothetical protein [Patescibacteria group bacterium]MCL5410189.1 hypothetical protein [Patescibacteria group bacterium]
MINSTQDHIPIEDIVNNLVFLKDGSVALVITTSAVNFGLLFETEQIAIIDAFAGFLNSLSFPIQVTIISRRLDVSSYLDTIDRARARQKNQALLAMTDHYRQFVESLIKEKNVLEKKFYVTLNVSGPELGFFKRSTLDRSRKAITVLNPRKDHVLRQLSRIGLKARQLSTEELVKLYYDIYNPEYSESEIAVAGSEEESAETEPTSENKQPGAPVSLSGILQSLVSPQKQSSNQELTPPQETVVPSPATTTQAKPEIFTTQNTAEETPPTQPLTEPIAPAEPITPSVTPQPQLAQPSALHPLFFDATPQTSTVQPTQPSQANPSNTNTPFVVEELPENGQQ